MLMGGVFLCLFQNRGVFFYAYGGCFSMPLKIFPQPLSLILKEILQKNFALKYIKILLLTNYFKK